MQKKGSWARIGVWLLCAAAMCLFLGDPSTAAKGVQSGLRACVETIIPTMFPFFVFSRMLLSGEGAKWLSWPLRPLTAAMGIASPKAASAILCGWMGGFAAGAAQVGQLYQSGEITKREGALLLAAGTVSGPSFVAAGVGGRLLGSLTVGWVLFAAQCAASALCGIVLSFLLPERERDVLRRAVTQYQACDAAQAVTKAVQSTSVLCGYVTLFSFLSAYAQPFGNAARYGICFFLEVTNACIAAAQGGGAFRVVLCASALSAMMAIGLLLFVFDVFQPIRQYNGDAARLAIMGKCIDRIEEVLQEPELPDFGTQRMPAPGGAPEIEFRNVSFGYGETEVLHQVSFSQPRNTLFALVGPSGGGKTTIANLLARFWDVQKGSVLVRGVDVRRLPLGTLMDHISMVFQNVYLFHDTIYNNIAMGRPDASREEVIEAAKQARCYDFIMALPDGFDTMVGEGGANLSGGERQRISIARCILKDAPIVILDEATANVDADNESYIQEAISSLCRGKTLLVIAHRLNTIFHADRILVVERGAIVQAGRHEELAAQEGVYRRFVAARSGGMGWNRR